MAPKTAEELDKMGDIAKADGDSLLAMAMYACALAKELGAEVVLVGLFGAFNELMDAAIKDYEKEARGNGRPRSYTN